MDPGKRRFDSFWTRYKECESLILSSYHTSYWPRLFTGAFVYDLKRLDLENPESLFGGNYFLGHCGMITSFLGSCFLIIRISSLTTGSLFSGSWIRPPLLLFSRA